MNYPIIWSPKAKITYYNILRYLSEEWTEKEVIDFTHRVSITIKHISHNYQLYPYSVRKNAYRAVITKQTSLLYRFKNGSVQLVMFWDNRQNPDKLTKV
ncbi:type II toxin-antitoxin system RelE/ParE family toxin [Mucilaginibacter terrae]|uniref:Type II toxin-antitoxin system RelE/ParE family toxin n=1 Tax=Mucilaginibacter terrae TaxID=1955052 RepID=A0ABU3GVM5_9SPHI|nr:hypothetical protein [Mucilaginibacter terrae]MDT3403828.1 hypothetical protein [Mucilaginibacter terrae]